VEKNDGKIRIVGRGFLKRGINLFFIFRKRDIIKL